MEREYHISDLNGNYVCSIYKVIGGGWNVKTSAFGGMKLIFHNNINL